MSGSNDSRFRKGQSGNPAGRPRKKREPEPSSSAFAMVLDQVIPINDGDRTRELSATEALQMRTYQEALKGSRTAQRVVMKMIAKREAWRIKDGKASLATPARVRHEQHDKSERIFAAIEALGIATRDSSNQLALEPWAVRQALQRMRGRKLNRLEVGSIRVATREWTSLGLDKYREPDGS